MFLVVFFFFLFFFCRKFDCVEPKKLKNYDVERHLREVRSKTQKWQVYVSAVSYLSIVLDTVDAAFDSNPCSLSWFVMAEIKVVESLYTKLLHRF